MPAQETAEYARDHLVELEQMTRAEGLQTLAYLIHLAVFEAEMYLGVKRPVPGPITTLFDRS